MDKINESIKKEQEKLNSLLEKRLKIEDQIKACESKIRKLTNMNNQKKFTEVKDVLDIKGLSLEEVMAAIKSGDLLSLQEKLQDNDNS